MIPRVHCYSSISFFTNFRLLYNFVNSTVIDITNRKRKRLMNGFTFLLLNRVYYRISVTRLYRLSTSNESIFLVGGTRRRWGLSRWKTLSDKINSRFAWARTTDGTIRNPSIQRVLNQAITIWQHIFSTYTHSRVYILSSPPPIIITCRKKN